MNAFYDPDNEIVQKFSKPLAEKMTELNKTLKFKN